MKICQLMNSNKCDKKNSLSAQSIFRSFEEKKIKRKREEESKCESDGIAHKSEMFFNFILSKVYFSVITK